NMGSAATSPRTVVTASRYRRETGKAAPVANGKVPAETLSEATLPACDRTCDLSGYVGVRAAKAFHVWRGDVHADVCRRPHAAHRNTESPIAPARKRQNRFGTGLACNSDSAWSQWKVGRRRDNAAVRECCEAAQLVRQGARVQCAASPAARISVEATAKKIAEPAGKISREWLEGLRHGHVRQPQRQLPKHVIELFATGGRVGKSLAYRSGKARRAKAERVRAHARSIGRPAKVVKVVAQFVTFGDSVGQQ